MHVQPPCSAHVGYEHARSAGIRNNRNAKTTTREPAKPVARRCYAAGENNTFLRERAERAPSIPQRKSIYLMHFGEAPSERLSDVFNFLRRPSTQVDRMRLTLRIRRHPLG
jgi:hypothetical protein